MRALVTGMLGAGLLLVGCSASDVDGEASDGVALPSDAIIEYDFQDSSVPPQYHRSFVLTITEAESEIVVDSYGDVLADETVPTSPEVWRQLSDGYPELAGLSLSPTAEECTGGTSFDLTVIRPTETLLQMRADMCGGGNEDVDLMVTDWLAPARAQFPPMSDLAPEGE